MTPLNDDICDLVTYEVENYGKAEYAEHITVSNGDFRRARSMMPFQYLDKRASNYAWSIYGEDVSLQKKLSNAFIYKFGEWKKEGKGLYIFSKTKGSGKTFLACCLANELMERLDICVKFVSIPDLLEMTKKGFRDSESREELEAIRTAELLILDDIGCEMKKEWIDQELFRLIDSRYTSKRVTIFTSNVEIDSLRLDDRIIDRIFDMCIPLKLPEVSIRRNQANRRNGDFANRITKNTPDGAATPSRGNETI